MFGNNPIRSATTDPHLLAIEEAFYTLQGEGPCSGMPALFIRMAGCNLACHFCDTQFETQAENALPVAQHLDHLMQHFTAKQREFVVITGGEPLLQNIELLVQGLFMSGTKLIQIETAGTRAPSSILIQYILEKQVLLVCSPKTPKVNDMIAHLCLHWKYIVRVGEDDPSDGLPNRGTQVSTMGRKVKLYRPTQPEATIWLSPCDEYNAATNFANQDLARDLCLVHGYRLSLQIHKILGLA